MKDFRPALLSAASLVCLLGLAACSGGKSTPPKTADAGTAPPPQPAALFDTETSTPTQLQFCPQTAILAQAQSMTLFLPGRSDIASMVSTARLSNIAGSCSYNKKRNALEIAFKLTFTATNGPANHGQDITLPWFTAITYGDNILRKKDYQTTLHFDGNLSTATTTTKTINIEVPARETSADLSILAGFQMTPEQLAHSNSASN